MRKWAGRRATALTNAVLLRDYDARLGFTPCHWCGGRATTADHWPVGRDEGGPDVLDNMVPACRPCNSSRGARYRNAKYRNPPPPSRRW